MDLVTPLRAKKLPQYVNYEFIAGYRPHGGGGVFGIGEATPS